MTPDPREILIVDDEIGIRELLTEILQDEGFSVVACESAKQAMEVRKQRQPALVLLDIWMPDMDGLALLRSWRQEHLLTMPVMMMSGHATVDLAVEAVQLGAVDVLEKPIGLQKLLQAIRSAPEKFKNASMQMKCPMHSWPVSIGQIHRESLALEKLGDQHKIIGLVGETGTPFEWFARSFHCSKGVFKVIKGHLELQHINCADFKFGSFMLPYSEKTQRMVEKLEKNLEEHHIKIFFVMSQKSLSTPRHWMWLVIPHLSQYLDDLEQMVEFAKNHWINSGECIVEDEDINFEALKHHVWRGNYEELIGYLKTGQLSRVGHIQEICLDFSLDLKTLRDDFERRYLEYHLVQSGGNMNEMSRQVGLERTHLYRKLRHLGLKSSS